MSASAIMDALMQRASRSLGALRADVCVVRRPVATRDAGGAPIRSWTSSGPVDCRVDAAGTQPQERIMGGRFAGDADALISFPRGMDIANDDQIDVRGRTFDVINVPVRTYAFEALAICRVTG